jgi:TolB-like protein/Tfp pilus assembly protein PilF
VLGFFLISKLISPSRRVERSIAVLPFINDSPDQENIYFINGLMEEVLYNLQKIKDFRVLSRTSTEQYRGTTRPTIPEIAKKLDVNYIVEGSGQRYGNTFRLRVQLIAASHESHLWAESFEQEISETKDIFRIQTKISQSIAEALKATITPEEKQLIEKTPTANLTAYDFYNRGNEELTKYYFYEGNRAAVRKAKYFFNKALEYDSAFARGYTGLAEVYSIEYFSINESYYSKHWLDSILILADLALSYDDQLPEAYSERGFYYWQNGKIEQAITEYNKVLKYNPNNSHAYKILGRVLYVMDYNYADWVKALQYCHKAVSIEHGAELPLLFRNLGEVYGFAGYPEKQRYYYNEAFKLDGDSNQYYNALAEGEFNNHNYKKAIALFNKCYAKDSTNIWVVSKIANAYCETGKYKESLKYIKKVEGLLQSSVLYSAMKGIGYVYWLNGYNKEAKEWFDKQKKLSEESLKLGRIYSADANYDLAAVYAFTGEREKAYENLRIVTKIRVCPAYLLGGLKDDPLFNSIRNETEFQVIEKDLEEKYQAEHERVRKWLEELGKL